MRWADLGEGGETAHHPDGVSCRFLETWRKGPLNFFSRLGIKAVSFSVAAASLVMRVRVPTLTKRAMKSTNSKVGGETDRAGVAILVRDFRAVLLRYFERRNVPFADQEDAVQEVFARLLRREGDAPIETLEPYLFQTAASVAVDFHRRATARGRGAHTTYDDDLHAVEDFSPERIHGGREEVAIILKALLELPERTRTAFLLARLEKMRLSEIAKRLGLSVGGVEKNVRKAVAHLTARLEPPQ